MWEGLAGARGWDARSQCSRPGSSKQKGGGAKKENKDAQRLTSPAASPGLGRHLEGSLGGGGDANYAPKLRAKRGVVLLAAARDDRRRGVRCGKLGALT